MQTRQLVRLVAMDLAVWCLSPAVFLFFYVCRHAVTVEAIGPHLYLTLMILLGLSAVRLALRRLISSPCMANFASAFVISVVLGTLLAYYCLVLIGLQSWARVISWELITSYASQTSALMDTIGVPAHLAIAVFLISYCTLLYATYRYVKEFDWTMDLLRVVSGPSAVFIIVVGIGVCGIALYDFVQMPSAQKSEPLSLTFFPMAAMRDLQGHAVDQIKADKLDRMEDAARSSYVPNKGAARKNLIVFVVDALRPDHMGVYGYHRDTTPHLSQLAQARSGAVRIVRNVRASCADSSCGLLSLASSKYVHQFSNRPFTLQQVLRRHGYRIEMILGGDHTNFYGLKELYGEVESYFDGSMSSGYYINDDQLVVDQLARMPAWKGQPVMIQFHLMSAHILGKRHARYLLYSPSENYTVLRNRTNGDNEKFINFYDNGVVQADAIINELLAILQRKGYLNDTLVVITADHGEALGEHGLYAHANGVREEVLRIPLILVSYGYEPGVILEARSATAQVDIAPTILTEFGFPIPESWSGVPLQQARFNGFTFFQEGRAAGLIDQRDPNATWKYWFDAHEGREYAFNLTLDPKENSNAINGAPTDLRKDWRRQQAELLPGIQGIFKKAMLQPAAE